MVDGEACCKGLQPCGCPNQRPLHPSIDLPESKGVGAYPLTERLIRQQLPCARALRQLAAGHTGTTARLKAAVGALCLMVERPSSQASPQDEGGAPRLDTVFEVPLLAPLASYRAAAAWPSVHACVRADCGAKALPR
eukprot:1817118-Prymnesium_polylepis.1